MGVQETKDMPARQVGGARGGFGSEVARDAPTWEVTTAGPHRRGCVCIDWAMPPSDK